MTTKPTVQAGLLTWNIWAHHGDWPARGHVLTPAIRRANADIIALQETWRDDTDDHASCLADDLGYPHVVAHPPGYDDRGLVVLSRWPITLDTVLQLPDGGTTSESRIALAATPTGNLTVYVTHLNWHSITAVSATASSPPSSPTWNNSRQDSCLPCSAVTSTPRRRQTKFEHSRVKPPCTLPG